MKDTLSLSLLILQFMASLDGFRSLISQAFSNSLNLRSRLQTELHKTELDSGQRLQISFFFSLGISICIASLTQLCQNYKKINGVSKKKTL